MELLLTVAFWSHRKRRCAGYLIEKLVGTSGLEPLTLSVSGHRLTFKTLTMVVSSIFASNPTNYPTNYRNRPHNSLLSLGLRYVSFLNI